MYRIVFCIAADMMNCLNVLRLSRNVCFYIPDEEIFDKVLKPDDKSVVLGLNSCHWNHL